MGICCSKTLPTSHHSKPSTNTLHPLNSLSYTHSEPLTLVQLTTLRNTFWETQPTYSGNLLIWQALRAVCESENHQLAQQIITCSNISLSPLGLLDNCYDELGNQYCIPAYCYSIPTNLISNNFTELSTTTPLKNTPESIKINIRTSNGNDIELYSNPLNTCDSLIQEIKNYINKSNNTTLCSEYKIRIFYLGKEIPNHVLIKDINSNSNYKIQAMIFNNH